MADFITQKARVGFLCRCGNAVQSGDNFAFDNRNKDPKQFGVRICLGCTNKGPANSGSVPQAGPDAIKPQPTIELEELHKLWAAIHDFQKFQTETQKTLESLVKGLNALNTGARK